MRMQGAYSIESRIVMRSDESSSDLLVRIAKQRDRSAFSILFERHKVKCFSILVRILGDRGLAEDSLQEGMLRVWRGAGHFNPQNGNAPAWILQVVVRKGLRRLKIQAKNKRLADNFVGSKNIWASDTLSPIDNLKKDEESKAFQKLINQLSPTDRQILVLYFSAEYSQKDIARELHIPQTTISNRLRYSLSRIKKDLVAAGYAALIPLLENSDRVRDVVCSGELVADPISRRVLNRVEGLDESEPVGSSLAYSWIWVGLLFVGTIVGALMIPPDQSRKEEGSLSLPEKKNPQGEIVSSEADFVDRSWNFNKEDTYPDLLAVQGSVVPLRNQGIDDSGCIELKGGTVLCVDTPIQSFPVILSYKLRLIRPKKNSPKVQFVLRNYWRPESSICDIINYFKFTGGSHKAEWVELKIYIKEKVTEVYADGNRRVVAYYDRGIPGKNYIYVSTDCLLDEVRLLSVSLDQCPDSTDLENAVRSIPKENRKGMVPLNGLPSSHRSQPVFVNFDSEASIPYKEFDKPITK